MKSPCIRKFFIFLSNDHTRYTRLFKNFRFTSKKKKKISSRARFLNKQEMKIEIYRNGSHRFLADLSWTRRANSPLSILSSLEFIQRFRKYLHRIRVQLEYRATIPTFHTDNCTIFQSSKIYFIIISGRRKFEIEFWLNFRFSKRILTNLRNLSIQSDTFRSNPKQ